MKRAAIYISLFVLLISCTSSQYISGGGRYDISDNLDLEAVAYLFGESEDLREFEYRLNDPEIQISNLDLNRDGYIDYLRVIDASRRGTYLVVVQAVLDRNMFQDVATIAVGRDAWGRQVVEIVGDDYLYGPNYILVPEYAHRPAIFGFFMSSRYQPWHSPYHWGYYPSYYVHRRPRPVPWYHEHIHRHHYVPHASEYSRSRRVTAPDYNRRNDYGSRRPENSFINRNEGVRNRQELNRRRSESPVIRQEPSTGRRPADQPVRRPQAVPQETPAGREQTAPLRTNPDSKPVREHRSSPSRSGRGSGGEIDTPPTERVSPAKTSRSNTAAPSVRTESAARRQSANRPAKETRSESQNRPAQSKSKSGRR